jgi:c-di-GMP-binding flagellar brake protein YcgR
MLVTAQKETVQSSRSNRRASKRMSARTSVSVEVRKGALGLGTNLAAQLLDISEGGVRVILKAPLDQKSEAEITLTGHGIRKAIKRIAVVSWSVKLESGLYATGLQFEKRIRYIEVTGFARP